MASARAPRSWGRFPFGQSTFEIRTVSEIEQRRAAEYDRVATDAIADLRHPEIRRPQRVAHVEAVLYDSAVRSVSLPRGFSLLSAAGRAVRWPRPAPP
jgi:hypothetical protein